MAARQIYPKAQRVGRARSPLRAGVGRADPAFLGLESYRPRPYGRGYELRAAMRTPENGRRAEDRQLYQRFGFDKAKPSGEMCAAFA